MPLHQQIKAYLRVYWPLFTPLLTGGLLLGFLQFPALHFNSPWSALAALTMILAVLASVHHAELIAHRVGEPYGTLVLALAVTIIETALILSMMIAGGSASAALPRDTIYSAVMIICNGVVGISLLVGGLHHKEQRFRIEGTGSGFAALVTLTFMVLVMPTLTTSSPEGTYTQSQLLFVALSSLSLWMIFIFIQTVRHRTFFLLPSHLDAIENPNTPPSKKQAWISLVLLFVALLSVVGLAKILSPPIEAVVQAFKAPKAIIGIIIALIVLLPETVAAIRAAKANHLQTSMNLAIGSALASIGLTIPLVVVASALLHLDLRLGLEFKDIAMLGLTFLVGSITLSSGRTNMMQGAIHMVIFASFLFLSLVP